MTIAVFKAHDGKWQYAPQSIRNWPQFKDAGRFQSKDEAVRAASEEHPRDTIKVEAGFFFRSG